MNDWRIVATLFGAISGVYVIIILYYRWVSKHMSDSTIHPNKSDLVYEGTCEQIQVTNRQEHCHLNDCIEGAERRTEQRYTELKMDTEKRHKELTERTEARHTELKKDTSDKHKEVTGRMERGFKELKVCIGKANGKS